MLLVMECNESGDDSPEIYGPPLENFKKLKVYICVAGQFSGWLPHYISNGMAHISLAPLVGSNAKSLYGEDLNSFNANLNAILVF